MPPTNDEHAKAQSLGTQQQTETREGKSLLQSAYLDHQPDPRLLASARTSAANP